MCQCHDSYVDQPTTVTPHRPVGDVAGDQCHDQYQTVSTSAHSPNARQPKCRPHLAAEGSGDTR
jgi:hypothetical protein